MGGGGSKKAVSNSDILHQTVMAAKGSIILWVTNFSNSEEKFMRSSPLLAMTSFLIFSVFEKQKTRVFGNVFVGSFAF